MEQATTTCIGSQASLSTFVEMLQEIVDNDQKQQQDGFVNVAPIAFWTKIFAKYFLHVNNPNHDDLLFYVKKPDGSESNTEVEVFRRESSKAPGLGDPNYDWTETVYLNLILQQLEYTLSCAICTKESSPQYNVVIHKKVSQQVYASPSRHNMEEKGKGAELCYPNIFFTIDSFDEIWNDLFLDQGKIVCVEIVASDKSKKFGSVIFLGSVTHKALTEVYNRRTKNNISWTQVMSLGLAKTEEPVEFVRMKGPNGKGYAEMAIRKCTKEETAGLQVKKCTCTGTSSTVGPCPLHPFPTARSDPELSESHAGDRSKKGKWKGKFFQESLLKKLDESNSRPEVAQSLPTSPTEEKSPLGVLKTHLTYVTLPWHKIILDILQSFEKPSSAKRPVLHKIEHKK